MSWNGTNARQTTSRARTAGGRGPGAPSTSSCTGRPRSAERNRIPARRRCQREVTTTSSLAPSASAAAATFAALPAVVPAVRSLTSTTPGADHAPRIRSASEVPAGCRAQPGQDHGLPVAGELLARGPGARRRSGAASTCPGPSNRAPRPRDQPPRRLCRRYPAVSNVPMTVNTSTRAFLPWSFDSPPHALPHLDRDLLDDGALVVEPEDRLHLRCAARVGPCEHGQRLGVGGVHAARRVLEGPAEDERHRAAQECRFRAGARARSCSGTPRSRRRTRTASRRRRRTPRALTFSSRRLSSAAGCWPSASTRPQ